MDEPETFSLLGASSESSAGSLLSQPGFCRQIRKVQLVVRLLHGEETPGSFVKEGIKFSILIDSLKGKLKPVESFV